MKFSKFILSCFLKKNAIQFTTKKVLYLREGVNGAVLSMRCDSIKQLLLVSKHWIWLICCLLFIVQGKERLVVKVKNNNSHVECIFIEDSDVQRDFRNEDICFPMC